MQPHSDSARPLGERERFVAFSFAAADLLVEANLDGRIIFAAGAFRARLGRPPEELVGGGAIDLLAPEHRAAGAVALAMMPARGRLEPMVVHLADPARTPMVLSGLHLALPGLPPRLCLSLGPLPVRAGEAEASPAGAGWLLRHAEERLRAGGESQLGLIEIPGVAGQRADVARALSDTLAGQAVASEVSPGRFGIMPHHGQALPDLAQAMRAVDGLLPGEGMGAAAQVSSLSLSMDGLTPQQAARALRHCLSAFTAGGVEALGAEATDGGLSSVVRDVGKRTTLLRRALAERRFKLEYQPILSLADRRLHHYEALLRPEKGLLGQNQGPGDFVNLAEMVGLTEELDLAVLDAAMRDTALLGAGERIAVNVSGLSMQDMGFRDKVLARLAEAPEARRRLMVELTETAEIEQEARAADTIAALRDQGLAVCLDDFGAGAAAFRYLKAFPVDFVKVDGAFVDAALQNERDRSMVSAMVDLSLAVGAKVIAEKIETEQHAHVMQQLGVGFGQGWLLGRPGAIRPPAPAARGRRGPAQEQWG